MCFDVKLYVCMYVNDYSPRNRVDCLILCVFSVCDYVYIKLFCFFLVWFVSLFVCFSFGHNNNNNNNNNKMPSFKLVILQLPLNFAIFGFCNHLSCFRNL